MHNAEGEQTWERSLDTFGKVITGDNNSCPFMYQGQYYDPEIELAYNRFRYYDPEDGRYISVDPIGLFSGQNNLYSYIDDTNSCIDVFGLTGTYMFTDGKKSYIGKGKNPRSLGSMRERIGGKDNATQHTHVDYNNNNTGLMVEAELMRRHDAINDPSFGNAINSPGEKKLADAELNDRALYDDIQKKADDFETEHKKSKGYKK